MEIDELKEKNLQKQLRKEAIRTKLEIVRPEQTRNDWIWELYYSFLFLALLQPFLFMTGLWNESIYHPVVGYDQIIEKKLVVECPKDYPTPKYETYLDCPGAR